MREAVMKNFSFLVLAFLGCLENLSHVQVNGQDPLAYTLAQDSQITLAAGSTLGFSKVITHMGPDTDFNFPGVFTSPTDGIYKFQVYSTIQSNRISLELYKNQELVASLYGWSYNDWSTTGNAVILLLTQGDEISIQSNSQTDVALYGSSSDIFTTFSGVRLVAANVTDTGVAFSVTLTSHKTFLPGYTILYDKFLLNQGSGYNTDTGVFTAPVAGVYIFHFFSLAQTNESIWQDLYHNSEYICSLSGLSLTDRAGAGNTAILYLRYGDTVQVKAKRTNKLFGEASQIYSTFSGILIVPESLVSTGSKSAIAFSAGLTRSITVAANSMVAFNRIFINLQHAFDQRTGNFTAPVEGLYEFNVHAQAQSNHRAWLDLYRNNQFVVTLRANIPYPYSNPSQMHGTSGNSVIIQLQVGDSVYLKARYSGYYDTSVLYGAHDQVYCTFSGYLIAPTYTGLSIVG